MATRQRMKHDQSLHAWQRMDTVYNTVGKRLRAERERLGLSQEELAARCGVHRRSQGNYELDKRVPDAGYWEAARRHGIDSEYVLTGLFVAPGDTGPNTALLATLSALVVAGLGYPVAGDPELVAAIAPIFDAFEASMSAADRDEQVRMRERSSEQARRLVLESPVVREIAETAASLDSVRLANVLSAVDEELRRSGRVLPADKRGQLVSALYRSAKMLGRVDPATVADAVALAA